MRTIRTLAVAVMLGVFGVGCSNVTDSDSRAGSPTGVRPTSHTEAAPVSNLAPAEPADPPKTETPAEKNPAPPEERTKPADLPGGQAKKAAPADRVHGKWSGVTKAEMSGVTGKIAVDFEFKPDGRVFWKEKIRIETGIPGGNKEGPVVFEDAGEGSGTYTVTRVEGDRFTLKLTNDLEPGRSFGWVVVFKGPDQITVTGFEDVPVTVQRKK
jgi:hypothetical protein